MILILKSSKLDIDLKVAVRKEKLQKFLIQILTQFIIV